MSSTIRKNEAKWVEAKEHWRIAVQSNGERREFYSKITGRRGKLEAEYKADIWLETKKEGGTQRVDTILDEWIKWQEDAGMDVAQYRSISKTRIKPSIGRRQVRTITERDLQNIIDEAFKDGLSHHSLKNIRGCLTSFVRYCRKAGASQLHPEDLSIPKSAPRGEKSSLTPDEIRKLFSSSATTWREKVVSDFLIHAYRFGVCTGLRPGELLGLQWKDIDMNTGLVKIQRSLNTSNKITSGKNERAIREFYVNEQAQNELREQMVLLSAVKLLNEPWVFPWINGGPTRQTNFYKAWKRYAAHNGITALSPYEMSRHTNVSINKRMPDLLLKKSLGHGSSMDTKGNYGHVFDRDLIDQRDISSALLGDILAEEE